MAQTWSTSVIRPRQLATLLVSGISAVAALAADGGGALSPAQRYALATDQEKSGAVADSYFNAQRCARDAAADRKAADRDHLVRQCQELALHLVPRVGYLVVEVTDRPVGSEVWVVGHNSAGVTLGVPTVVTPGAVTVKANAPGRISHWETIEVNVGQTRALKIDLTPMPDGSGTLTTAQKQEIRAHYQRASRDFDLGKFLDAIEEYQVIYEIAGDPVMLYNLAQSYRLAEQPDKAIQFYRRYLQRMPGARNREAVEQKIGSLEKALAEQRKGTATVAP